MQHSEALQGKDFILLLTHNFFRSYSLYLHFAFGSLLIYAKTSSIPLAIGFSLIGSITDIFLLTIGLNSFLKIWNRLGLQRTMLIGLCAMALSYAGVFYLAGATSVLFFGVLNSLGGSLYYWPYHLIKFTTIGTAKESGKYSSIFGVIVAFSALAAAVTGLIIGEDQFLILLLFATGLLVLAALLLLFIRIQNRKYVTTAKAVMRSTSYKTHFSYFEFSHELSTVIVPLFVLVTFGSIGISIWVAALSEIGAAVGIWFAGSLHDRNSITLTLTAGLFVILSWFGYTTAQSPWFFATLGICISIGTKIVRTAIDAKLGREAVHDPLNILFAVEISKHTGRILALLISLGAFFYLQTIPSLIFVFGAVFFIPRLVYALHSIHTSEQAQ